MNDMPEEEELYKPVKTSPAQMNSSPFASRDQFSQGKFAS